MVPRISAQMGPRPLRPRRLRDLLWPRQWQGLRRPRHRLPSPRLWHLRICHLCRGPDSASRYPRMKFLGSQSRRRPRLLSTRPCCRCRRHRQGTWWSRHRSLSRAYRGPLPGHSGACLLILRRSAAASRAFHRRRPSVLRDRVQARAPRLRGRCWCRTSSDPSSGHVFGAVGAPGAPSAARVQTDIAVGCGQARGCCRRGSTDRRQIRHAGRRSSRQAGICRSSCSFLACAKRI
mmetsp:Transcript_146/g.685  ORF Transcript_146/g.685 Transcript_146/m.685 type:complete len:234 (-) Transcript_146:91-792(-)